MPYSRSRILYVDDDPDTCEMMKVWFRVYDGSYDVTAVTTIDDANSVITESRFDLYVLDYCLPEMSGAELCRMIRRVDATKPILIYSALSRPIDREMAMNAGADVYLIKPDDFDLLGPTVRQLLERRIYISRPSARHGRMARGIV